MKVSAVFYRFQYLLNILVDLFLGIYDFRVDNFAKAIYAFSYFVHSFEFSSYATIAPLNRVLLLSHHIHINYIGLKI